MSIRSNVHNKTFTDKDISAKDWQTKYNLIKFGSTTVVQYFDYTCKQFSIK